MFKVIFLAVACLIVTDARRLNSFFWEDDSGIQERSYSHQVCTDVKQEEVVSTDILLNKQGSHFFPDEVQKLSCKTEGKQAAGVSDSSIICKTKEKIIEIVEYNNNGQLIGVNRVKVPVDCVAYKI